MEVQSCISWCSCHSNCRKDTKKLFIYEHNVILGEVNLYFSGRKLPPDYRSFDNYTKSLQVKFFYVLTFNSVRSKRHDQRYVIDTGASVSATSNKHLLSHMFDDDEVASGIETPVG